MSKVLSQDEVDSLLDGISQGAVETETDIPESEAESSIESYDFRQKAGPLHTRMPGLGMISERLAGLLNTSFVAATRSTIDVSLTSIDTMKFNEFSSALPLPASLNIFKMEPLRGFSLLVIEGPLVFTFVDCFFGGKGVSHVKLEGRSFTAIESTIIEKVARITLNDLKQAWGGVYQVEPVLIRSEMDTKFASIVSPDDTVITLKYLVELENHNGSIMICIPYTNIEPIKDKLGKRFQDERTEIDTAWQRYIEKKVKEMKVRINCTLGGAKISGKDFLCLKKNDVIPLDKKVGEPIAVCVQRIPKFDGFPGAYNNHRAIRINSRIKEE